MRSSKLVLVAAVLGASAVAVPPARARAELQYRCSNRPPDQTLMTMTGSKGSGSTYEVSSYPSSHGRSLPADGGTDRYWHDMWECLAPAGGYNGARLSPSQGESLYQQLWCHIRYNTFGGGDTWDLEAHRPPITWDRIRNPARAASHKCNW